jgi:hypothetical protein
MNGYSNLFQRLACEAFPNADLLPFAVADGIAVEQAVKNGKTGNKLFDFVFAELADLPANTGSALNALGYKVAASETARRLQAASKMLATIAEAVQTQTRHGPVEAKAQWLREHGYVIVERDPRLNTNYAGRYMVTEADFEQDELPTEDASNGPFCVVGDNLVALVEEAFEAVAT